MKYAKSRKEIATQINRLIEYTKDMDLARHLNLTYQDLLEPADRFYKFREGEKILESLNEPAKPAEKECKHENDAHWTYDGWRCDICNELIQSTPEPKIETLGDLNGDFSSSEARDTINSLITYTSSLEKRIKELEK